LIPKIEINGRTTKNSGEMAALFNELFTSVPSKIVQDLCMTDLGACPKLMKDFTPIK
jgi:hypothetical protein